MRERNECLENGDEEAMYVVEKSIESLFRMALKHPEFKEQEEQLRMML